MVKDSKMRPAISKLPRPKRGRPFGEEQPRDHRMMMRVHADLMELVDAHARERGESRSRFIEKLLIAYLKSDPRNPKIDAAGRIDADAPAPLSATVPAEAARFGAAWAKFSQVNAILFGLQVPDEWMNGEAQHQIWAAHRAPDPDAEEK